MLYASVVSDDPTINLQLALGVELAVLPPYLYALWSIKPAEEGASVPALEAARSIRAVVYEEMLHAGLVANTLNALGTKPNLVEHLVHYPGPLPGHASEPPYGYVVELGPVSADTVSMFLKIERPGWEPPEVIQDPQWITINDLYDHLLSQLEKLGPHAFDHGHQLPLGDNPGPGRMIAIDDIGCVRYAVRTVLDQGEGHKPPPPPPPGQPPDLSYESDDEHEVAHYYQFQNIAGYLADGLIDGERDLYPVVANPDPAAYSPQQQSANHGFNELYTELINTLQATLGSPEPRAFGPPTQLMNQLEQRAAVLRSAGPIPGTNQLAGPTFEYLDTPNGGAT